MQERQVTVDGVSHLLPSAFTVFATQNPVEHEGTYPLPEAQLDRFLLKIIVDYPDAAAERGILDRYADGFSADRIDSYGIGKVAAADDLLAMRRAVGAVHVEPRIRDYIVAVIRATRTDPYLSLAGSPRASVALFAAARAQALLEERDFVIPDDVKQLTIPVLRHRIRMTPEAEVEGLTPDARLAVLLEGVDAPK
jgi:MoxR-like ATPase